MIGGAMAGGVMDIAQNEINYQKQKNFYNQTANDNMERSKEMALYNNAIAYNMWKKTGVVGQMEQLKKAGMNPALMYGDSGGGGGTANVTPQNIQGQMPDTQKGGGIIGMQLGAQLGQQIANTELIKAQTNKTNAEAENLRGSDRKNTIADTTLKGMQAEAQRLANIVSEETTMTNVDKAKAEYNAVIENLKQQQRENKFGEEMYKERVHQFRLETTAKILENELTEAQKDKTNEETRAISVRLAQEWEALSIRADELTERQKQNAIYEFGEKWQARLGLGNLQMRKIEAGLNTAGKILGGRSTTTTTTTMPSGNQQTTITKHR